jgi:protocatechuate 3,4-dioxygenase beta subunit
MPDVEKSEFITAQMQVDTLAEAFAKIDLGDELAGMGDTPPGVTVQTFEGPYYVGVDDRLIRQDITSGRPGIPLKLRFTVLEAVRRTPLAGAAVDVWHCDALGYYSGHLANSPNVLPGGGDPRHVEPTDESRFLRGRQFTGADGAVEFQTIYPGWYYARSVHIHVKAYLDGHDIYNGQLYLPEDVNKVVEKLPPYNLHPDLERLPNDRDLGWSFASSLMLDVRQVTADPEEGFTGEFTVAIAAQ